MGQNLATKINIGNMVHKMVFFRPVVTTSSTGQRKTTYEPDVTFLSDVIDNTTSSANMDNNQSAKRNLKFYSYFKSGVTVDWKVEFKGEQYDIETIVPDSKELMAEYVCVLKLNV